MSTFIFPTPKLLGPMPGSSSFSRASARSGRACILLLRRGSKSPAHREGKFLIAGEFLPAYREKLAPMLAHTSVHVLGHRDDVPELMRTSDILVLPSIEEGSALVCSEAMGSGCVPLVSNACTDLCRHMENALVHRVGDVATLTRSHYALAREPRNVAGTESRRSSPCTGDYLERGRSTVAGGLPRNRLCLRT